MTQERDDCEGTDEDGRPAGLIRLRQLCRSAEAPEPDEAAWNATLARIVATVGPGRSRRARPWWIAAGTAAAAAAVLVVVLARSWWTLSPVPTQPAEEPYPVAAADDVTILSMDARDVAALVVGEPPIVGEVEFVRPEDVRVLHCERCPHSGNLARLEPGEVPMFVTTVARADGDE